MTSYFAIDYTIHFDDTMAYGGHHFLTAFKLQCASREAFLFGEHVFDQPGVKEALAGVHLLTSDAYARNLRSMRLGDRVAIFLTLEEWGRASARFCYRVLDHLGNRVCAGFQTLICADARSGQPLTLPTALSDAMNRLRDLEERRPDESFRDIVLAGGSQLDELFGDTERELAIGFLSDRYPRPGVVHKSATLEQRPSPRATTPVSTSTSTTDLNDLKSLGTPEVQSSVLQAWAFAGQGAFDAGLLCRRLGGYTSRDPDAFNELQACQEITEDYFGEPAHAIFSADRERCLAAIQSSPGLSQVAILLQNVLGARLWRLRGQHPEILVGHSFGEIAAFEVAGCFDLTTAVHIVCLRNQAIERHAPAQSGLLAVFAERHRVHGEASLLGLSKVCIAGRNHDMQTIASGPLAQLESLRSHFEKLGVQSARIQSPTSFHHPDLTVAATHWLESMRPLSFRSPKGRIYSPIGRRLVGWVDDVAGVLASQLLRPFDLQGSIEDLAAMGITQIVDCGSTGALANLITKAGRDLADVRCAASLESAAELDASIRSKNLAAPIVNGSHHPHPGWRAAGLEREMGMPEELLDSKETSVRPGSNRFPVTAIVGRGCILPAGAKSPAKLYDSVMQQRVGLIDQRALDPHWTEDFYSEKLVPDRSTSHLSGRVDDTDIACPPDVDYELFETFTRTQKLLCVALSPCVSGLRDAQRVVCLMGATADGFEDQDEATSLLFAGIDPSASEVDRLMNTARSAHQTPHQAIQYVLDQMVKPAVQVILLDAACASSLYTTALGMRLLETDQADAVIAGGVFCPGPGNSCLFSQFRGTTSTGCRPFDANADGVVFSEGAAILTLRRAADAARLGLKIDGVIRGAGLSSDGRSSSANVPQSHGQILSLQRCYDRYEIDPHSIIGIEGHGTSTPVGDSTEVETLRQFFAPYVTSPIPLHSLKGSIGHAGWAAGTASVIAACEYLHRQTFPAQGFYREPSEAVQQARQVLTVATEPTPLRSQTRRIAVDGFGFGGANAHLVIEDADGTVGDFPQASRDLNSRTLTRDTHDDEIVLVALHQMEPTAESATGIRFDRDSIKLPGDFIVLPELADDMDISQTLTVLLTHQIIASLSGLNDELRKETCVVLAMSGKTERGVEATTRVLTQRLKRKLCSDEKLVESIERTFRSSRPSKAYTLQCMMPNVASGRAALLLNLRGPNFVVDSGDQSLDAALLAASLLLEDGDVPAQLAIVASVSASAGSDPHSLGRPNIEEHAAAFALTSRAVADQYRWKPLIGLDQLRTQIQSLAGSDPQSETLTTKMRSLIERVDHLDSQAISSFEIHSAEDVSIEDIASETCPIHTPLWVEKPYPLPAPEPTRRTADKMPAAIFIVPADSELIEELFSAVRQRFSRSRIIMVGEGGSDDFSHHAGMDWHWISNLDQPQNFAELVCSFSADLVVAVQRPKSQDFRATLRDISQDNSLCEAVFMAAQHEIERLKNGSLELWGLVINGWSAEIHPCSGAIAGLLKSICREIPQALTATLCTGEFNVSQSLDRLLAERIQADSEPEIVFDGNTRKVRRLMPVVDQSSPHPQVKLDTKSVVVASGGARGVTAVMLDAVVRDFGCTVIALGRSPLESGPRNSDAEDVEQEFYRQFVADHPHASPVQMRREFESTRAKWEAARNIESLRSLGANVEYHVVDVTKEEEVSRVIADIAVRYGRVDFLIHGAGVQVSKQLQHRSLSDFRRTFQVKVKGLHLLVDSCFEHFGRLVDTHVLTSAYSIFGNDGQHDYCAANETMDRLCAVRRLTIPEQASQWTSIAWLAWEGIGMTRGTEYRALAKQRSLTGVDEATGQRLFRAVIAGRTGVAINVPLSPAEHAKYGIATVPKTQNGLADRWMEVPVDLNEIGCLRHHKVRNSPTLPGAWIINHFVDVASKIHFNANQFEVACIRDISFHRFVRLLKGKSPNLRVVARQQNESIDVWMIVDLLHPSGELLSKDVLCATATIEFREQASPSPTLHDPGFDVQTAAREDPYCRHNSMVELSGPFQCLREITIDRESRRAIFDSDSHGDWTTITPALALDAAWRVGAMYANASERSLFVPVNIEEVVLPFATEKKFTHPRRWTIVSTDPNVSHDGARWSRTEVCDEHGQMRISVKNAYARPIE